MECLTNKLIIYKISKNQAFESKLQTLITGITRRLSAHRTNIKQTAKWQPQSKNIFRTLLNL